MSETKKLEHSDSYLALLQEDRVKVDEVISFLSKTPIPKLKRVLLIARLEVDFRSFLHPQEVQPANQVVQSHL